MIAVELMQAPFPRGQYLPVALLVVDDDGEVFLDDPEQLIPTQLHALGSCPAGSLRRIEFAEDPEEWARHLDSILRTGYLVPLVLRDSREAERSAA